MAIARPKSLRELALEQLRSQIIDGTLKMGQALSERRISEELGVSKSPVREALAQLRDEGLVIIEPQKVARVFTLNSNEVAQICDFRLAMETAAFELALARNPIILAKEMEQLVREMTAAQAANDTPTYLSLDTQFHQLIFKHAANIYLSASYSRYVGKIAALRTHLASMPLHTKLSYKEHKLIAKAAKNGDMINIRTLLSEHIDRTKQAYGNKAKTDGEADA